MVSGSLEMHGVVHHGTYEAATSKSDFRSLCHAAYNFFYAGEPFHHIFWRPLPPISHSLTFSCPLLLGSLRGCQIITIATKTS